MEMAEHLNACNEKTPCIVIGSGIAGLCVTLKIAEKGIPVTLITKKTRAESNTNYAQGGIACVMAPLDDFEAHIQDTLIAGDGLCNPQTVAAIIQEGPKRVQSLMEWGVHFSKNPNEEWDLGQEGGHSKRRILHVKDMTGAAIEKALLKATSQHPLITVREHIIAIDIITEHKINHCIPNPQEDAVLGLYAFNTHTQSVETLTCPNIILATGGCGQVYQYTTNPEIATGDGLAMAARLNVPIDGLEFMQFHPTALYNLEGERFLISEAIRGEGAILRNYKGNAFMVDYHPKKDLAPRDIVARAIDSEMKIDGSPHVWLDLTHFQKTFIPNRFPTIWKACQRHQINPTKDFIPVIPAAHYQCGGVITDLDGRTALKGLYACGEVASTGLHGANRLASNSLLEAVVMAHRTADALGQDIKHTSITRSLPPWRDESTRLPNERVVLSHAWEALRRTLWDYVGIVRTTERLQQAQKQLALLEEDIQHYYWTFKLEPKLIELRNLVLVGKLIIQQALARKKSCGLHYIQETL
jgi:L-aspartate oxidase